MKKIDLKGKRFNKWTALEYLNNGMWMCQCDCGEMVKVHSQNLRDNKSIGCSKCYHKRRFGIARVDYSGQKVNKWTLIKFISAGKYEAICDCGRQWIVNGNSIISGKSKSCRACGNIRLDENESVIRKLYSEYIDGATRRGHEWGLNLDDFKQMISCECFYCGKGVNEEPVTSRLLGVYGKPFNYNGIDRVDNSLGYSYDNVVSCCKVCNRAKRELSSEVFITWIQRIKKVNITVEKI